MEYSKSKEKKIELMLPAGSMAALKAAVSNGADSVYLGMNKFNAREFATNFNDKYLIDAIKICKSNNVKIYLTMNTLVKNKEIKEFFEKLSFAYSSGIDGVIIQEISFIPIIKKNFPGLRIHISTQAGVMNFSHANYLIDSDRINLARELNKENIKSIRKNFKKELEIFVHGALCVSVSGSCLFSSFLGGRSGNRGKCAQPCRKKYNNCFYLSTKELCLINRIPEIIESGIDCIKIEGRMRNPYYVATTASVYREAIDSFYAGKFKVTKEMIERLKSAFNREFTEGCFSSEEMFNRKFSSGERKVEEKNYEVKIKDIEFKREKVDLKIPEIRESSLELKQILVRVYNKKDAILACENGADIICYDLFNKDFEDVKKSLQGKCKVFAFTQRIMFDKDIPIILNEIEKKKPEGILAGNIGILNLNLDIPIHLDYNCNCFNDIDLKYFNDQKVFPIISPELSINELGEFKNKNFSCFVHGKIRLMTLSHNLHPGVIFDQKGKFFIEKIRNGCEILNEKELGLLNKAKNLLNLGIKNFYIDTEHNVGEIVKIYKQILDGKTIDVTKIKNNYVLGWSNRGVL